MAYDEYLADRVRQVFAERHVLAEEKKMMGGLCFMVNDKMCAGVLGETLMARIDPEIYPKALTRPGAREMDFTGRPMKGFILVEGEGIDEDEDLEAWLQLCLDYNPRAKSSKKKKPTVDKEKTMSQTLTGSCHCGQIKFEAQGDLQQVFECNCSICRRKGAKMWFVPRTQFKLLSDRDRLATYSFGAKRIQHHFCPTCGIAPFGEGTDPKGNEMAAINVRCLEGVDIEALPVQHFDGASL